MKKVISNNFYWIVYVVVIGIILGTSIYFGEFHTP